MKKKIAILTSSLTIVAVLALTGCGSGGRQITKEEEAAWKTPPKEPPAEYKGNELGIPQGPPSDAAKGNK